MHPPKLFSPLSGLLFLLLLLTGGVRGQGGPQLFISAPFAFSEGDGALALSVDLPAPVATPTLITVTATLLTPGSQQITIPAGSTKGFCLFLLEDDFLLQGPRQTVLRASAAGFTSAIFASLIEDDDSAELTLTLPPSIAEGSGAQGNITLSRPASYPVAVTLSASPSGLALASPVTIPAGFTSFDFYFSAQDDAVINPDFAVAVTATIPNWTTTMTRSLLVTNNDLRQLSIQVPASIAEDVATLTGKVTIPGSLTTPLEVALSSVAAGNLGVPASVVIPAGATEAAFALSPVNNPGVTGTRTAVITASAGTFTSGSATIAVTDVTTSRLSVTSAPGWAQIGATMILTVNAQNSDEITITSQNGPISAIWENAATGATLGAAVQENFSDGQVALSLPVPNTVEILRLRLTAAGLTMYTPDIRPYRLVTGKAVAIAVDPVRHNVLFTSGPGAAPGLANTLITVDPESGTLTPSAFIGSDPRALAITDDGAFAYAGLWSGNQIVQFNLATQSVVRTFSLTGNGFPWNSYNFFPDDIETVPGLPDSVLVAQQATGSTYTTTGLYRNGLFAADNNSPDLFSLARSRRTGVVYGFNNTDTGFDFGTLTATTNTLTVQRSLSSPFNNFQIVIEADGDLVVGSNGVVADGQTLLSRGRLLLPPGVSTWAVAADSPARRIYAADHTEGLYIFDAASLRQISRIALPGGIGAISQMKRWGSRGLVLRLASGSVLMLTHPDVAPTAPPADLAVNFEATDGQLVQNTAREFSLTVTNLGPNPAVAARLILNAPPDFSLSGLQAGAAQVEITGNSILARIGDLPSGATYHLRFKLSTSVLGPNIVSASAGSDSVDAVATNDAASLPVSVFFADLANTVHELPLYAVDMVAHPSLPLIYLSTGKDGIASLSNQVLEMDPRTGRVLRSLSTGQNPRTLAITDGGEYLYVGLGDVSKVLRVDLNTFSIGLSINLPATVYTSSPMATDIVTLAGQPDSFAVALSYYGVYIMDGQTVRTNHTGIYDGSRIERGLTDDVIYTYDDYTSGFEFTRLRLDASGATQESARAGFGGYYVDFVSSAGMALSSNGYLIDGSDMSLRGVLTGMTNANGTPALEMPRQRAYAVVGNSLKSFDTTRLANVRQVNLPSNTGYSTRKTIRWGADGFAMLQSADFYSSIPLAGRIVFVRSDIVPQFAPYEVELLVDQPVAPVTAVSTSQITLRGRAFAAAGMESVRINGVSAGPLNALGQWSKTVSLTPGANEFRITATTAGVGPIFKEAVYTVIYTPPLPIEWLDQMLPGVAVTGTTLTDDTDRDGWNTLAEFALNGDPKAGDASLTGSPDAADPMVFSFWRPAGAGTSAVVMRLQVSPGLSNWRAATASEVEWLAPGETSPDGHYQKARFRLHPGGPALYWRLWITPAGANAVPGGLVP